MPTPRQTYRAVVLGALFDGQGSVRELVHAVLKTATLNSARTILNDTILRTRYRDMIVRLNPLDHWFLVPTGEGVILVYAPPLGVGEDEAHTLLRTGCSTAFTIPWPDQPTEGTLAHLAHPVLLAHFRLSVPQATK